MAARNRRARRAREEVELRRNQSHFKETEDLVREAEKSVLFHAVRYVQSVDDDAEREYHQDKLHYAVYELEAHQDKLVELHRELNPPED